jgi:large subunit ribosomal protein L29
MKTSELRDLTVLELEKELDDKKEALAKLRFQKAKKTLDNNHSIRFIRRDIARIYTLLREKKEV